VPGIAVGLVASRRLAPLVDRGRTRSAVLVLSAAAALAAIARHAVRAM
jgi:hypothetical protein